MCDRHRLDLNPNPGIEEGVSPVSVARVSELSVSSNKSFEDAIQQGIDRATKTLRNVRSAWIKEQSVSIENDRVSEYKVNMLITFVLDN